MRLGKQYIQMALLKPFWVNFDSIWSSWESPFKAKQKEENKEENDLHNHGTKTLPYRDLWLHQV